MEKGKNGEKFKCKTFGSWWLWGGQQANYHTRPPIQLSLIVRPHADCKNKQDSWIVVKFWESLSLNCLVCKNVFENLPFSPVASVVSKYFAESPFHPWLRVPSLPPRRWLCRKVVLTFPYLIFFTLSYIFLAFFTYFVFNKPRKSSIVIDSPASFHSDCTVKLFWSSPS